MLINDCSRAASPASSPFNHLPFPPPRPLQSFFRCSEAAVIRNHLLGVMAVDFCSRWERNCNPARATGQQSCQELQSPHCSWDGSMGVSGGNSPVTQAPEPN